ncbi:MAG: hypothetical protein KDJ29_17745, partial [Hyphomicrobiales bacterium]|nr:hypothetical protein [Hyphomicrobiales bacterium]
MAAEMGRTSAWLTFDVLPRGKMRKKRPSGFQKLNSDLYSIGDGCPLVGHLLYFLPGFLRVFRRLPATNAKNSTRRAERMKVQGLLRTPAGDLVPYAGKDAVTPDLVLYFGAREQLASDRISIQLSEAFPAAQIVGCSTGGQIRTFDSIDDNISGVAVQFEHTRIRVASRAVGSATDSRACATEIAQELNAPDLAGIFVLSDGLNVNGS